MKKKQIPLTLNLILVTLLFFVASNISAQKIVDVAPGFNTLNQAIDGDTTATGERTDLNTIYRLERNGIYLLNGSLSNDGYPLNIIAADGDGARPKLIPAVPTGGESSRPFRPKGDLMLKGLYITGVDELGGQTSRMIRVSEENAKIVIEDCHIDKDSQSAFRFDDDGISLFMTNSIVSNIGRPLDPNNGRGIDDRGNDIDSLVMIGNTFYNITSRVLRDGGGLINYANIRNNTFMNIGQFVVSFGEVIKSEFTNNLVINGGFLGRNKNDVLGNGLAASNAQWIQNKPLGQDLIDQGIVQSIDIRNNNFYLDPALVSQYPDSVEVVPVYDSLSAVVIEANGTGDSNIEEAISFTNGSATETGIVATVWADLANTPYWNNTNEPYDFAYPTSATSYTQSTTGQPLGALTWFSMIVGVDEGNEVVIPQKYALHNNYPNPFNPSTVISFSLPKEELVSVKVFNMIGQEIATLINKDYEAGTHNVTFNASDLSSGMYVYQITAGKFTSSHKMLLLK